MRNTLSRLRAGAPAKLRKFAPAAVGAAVIGSLSAQTASAQVVPATVATYLDTLGLETFIGEGATELFSAMALLVPIAFAIMIGWKVIKSMGRV